MVPPSPSPGSLFFFGLNCGLYLPPTDLPFISFHKRRLILHCLPVFACLLLHCRCSTGTSLLCAINRSAPYWLMVMLLNLLSLLLQLLLEMKRYRPPNGINVAFFTNSFSWGFPGTLMIVAYMVEGNDAGTAFEILNKSRHSFSCSMRFKDATEEFSLLWAHFTWICGGIVVVVILTLSELNTLGTMSWRSRASATVANALSHRKLKASAWRIVKLSISVAILQIVNLVTRLQILKTLDAWTTSSNLWLQCKLKEDDFYSLDWSLYGFEDGQEICAVGAVGRMSECLTPCSYNATIDLLKLYDIDIALPLLCEQVDGMVRSFFNCECTCDDMVQVRTPPTNQVMLSLVSQSLIVVVVGIIMGLRLWLPTLYLYVQ
jgi:hypothetical protein